jgi:hypothetical protein
MSKENYVEVPIKISKKHVIKNAKNNNMDFEEAICEFIDNSIDAKATLIKISKKKTDIDKYFNLSFEDNGNGMSYDALVSAVSSYGSKGQYDNTSIGMYGVGLKDAVSNLCEKGLVRIETVKDKLLSRAEMSFDDDDLDGDASWRIYPAKPTNKKNGTNIYIPYVKGTTHNQPLLNFLSVTYYPRWKNDKNFKIQFNYNDEKPIPVVLEDPLYIDLMIKNKAEPHHRVVSILGENIEMMGFHYSENCPQYEDFIMFDKNVGRSMDGPRAAKRSGTFWNIGNRFSTLGDGIWHFSQSDQQIFNSCRILIKVPKNLQKYFVQINKSKINIDENDELLKEFVDKYKEIVNALRKDANKKIKDNPDNAGQIKDINEALRNLQKDKPVDLKDDDYRSFIEQIQPSVKNKTGKSNNRPSGLTYEKPRPFSVDIKMFDNQRELFRHEQKPNGEIVITLNESHSYYINYFRKLDISEKAIQVCNFYCQIVTLAQMFRADYLSKHAMSEYYDLYAKKLNEYHDQAEA